MVSVESSSRAWRSRPVFISSTFRDMHAERDYLRAHVFPRLEEELRARRHFLEPIDLRLGVETAQAGTEEARELLVLKVCLDEITRSRPFMLVLLGDRYGWVPPEERLVAAAREQGLRIDASGKSVTALEIEFGILAGDPSQRQRTLFFFRKPLPYAQMPPDVAVIYSDALSPDDRVKEGHRRLESLKQRIRRDPDLGSRVFDYSAAWNTTTHEVSGLEAFGELVYQELRTALDEETAAFAARSAPTWEEQERGGLDEFIAHRRRDFVGRGTLLNRLQAIALGTAGPAGPRGACVTGLAGSGKSALFAELHHRLAGAGTALVLANAAGATAHGSRVDAMLRRWVGELAVHLGVVNPIPGTATPNDVEAVFYSMLRQASQTTRVAVLVDALDQSEATPRGTHLTWFKPSQWPDRASLIATSLPCAAAEALARWASVEPIEIPALSEEDVAAVARAIWRRYHRDINPDVIRVLTEKRAPDGRPASSNPLWLTLALEQLNLLDADDFARADREFTGPPVERLRALIIDTATKLPADVEGLYAWLLAQNEKVFGIAAARAFTVAIALSQRGWREADLSGIMPRITGVLVPGVEIAAVDDLHLAALRRGFRAHVTRRGEWGQLDFSHAQMRAAVAARCLGDEALRRHLHARVSDYLETLEPADPIVPIERMWQLVGEGDVKRAASYYATLEERSPSRGEEQSGPTWTLVEWISAGEPRGGDQEALPANARQDWVESWLDGATAGLDERHRLASNLLWGVLYRIRDSVSVDRELHFAQAIERALVSVVAANPGDGDWQQDLAVCLEGVGCALSAKGNLTAALETFRRELAIAEPLAANNPDHPVWQRGLLAVLNNIGDVLRAQGDLAGASRSYRQGMAIAEWLTLTQGDDPQAQEDLAVSRRKLGRVLRAQGDIAGALEMLQPGTAVEEREPVPASARAEPQRDLVINHNQAGDALRVQGNLDEALTQYQRGLAIAERLVEADPGNTTALGDLAVGHHKLGEVFHERGDTQASLDAHRRGLAIAERLAAGDSRNAIWQHGLADSLESVAIALDRRGMLTESLETVKRAGVIRQGLAAGDPANANWQRDLAFGHLRKGAVLSQQGDLPGALAELERARAIMETLVAANPGHAEWQADLAASLDPIAATLLMQGDHDGAFRMFQRAKEIRQRLAAADPENAAVLAGLAASHHLLSDLAELRGDRPASLSELRQCFAVVSDMRRRGMHLSPALQSIYDRLSRGFAASPTAGGYSASGGATDVPQAHPAADPDAAFRLNMDYQRRLTEWKALSWWRRIRTPKPEPPRGI